MEITSILDPFRKSFILERLPLKIALLFGRQDISQHSERQVGGPQMQNNSFVAKGDCEREKTVVLQSEMANTCYTGTDGAFKSCFRMFLLV